MPYEEAAPSFHPSERRDRVQPYKRGGCPPFRKRGAWSVLLVSLITALLLFSSMLAPLAPRNGEGAPLASSASLSDTVIPGLSGTGDDFTLNARSSNLTVVIQSQKYVVYAQEYCIVADYSSSFVQYQIRPYYSTDYIRYQRVNPQYSGDGTIDQNGAALDSVSMTISNWGRDGTTVWFLESCAEFSLKQSFNIYRDYFELNVTYMPGSKNVLTTYYIGLCSSSNSLYNLMNGRINRYMPGLPEDTPATNGLGDWYPSYTLYAPACDLRVPAGSMGVEWGYSDEVAYIRSPVWLAGGSGGASVVGLKYTSLNSIIPNIALGQAQTFHMFVRPYKYTDGKDQGHDVGYAQWVATKLASEMGHTSQAIFPLAIMSLSAYTAAFQSWLDSSQVKLATYTTNSNQIDWNYKSAQMANMNPDTPSVVPKQWQVYSSPSTPLTLPDGSVVCNPVSGPYTTSGTYRWQLINNDPQQSWWTSSKGVFWDEMNMWSATNSPRNDYQVRSDFVYDGYIDLIEESRESGYWDYIIANSYCALLHLSMAADIVTVESYEPSSTYNVDMTEHVQSTMDFINNIPSAYRPRILVYQNYDTGSSADQQDVYSVLFASAVYGFDVSLVSYSSYSSQMHNLQMAEDMFEAMGCTRDSDARIAVSTLDLGSSSTLTTSASMVVMKGSGTPTITSTSAPDRFKLTNLNSGTNNFNVAFQSSAYYAAGTNVQSTGAMTYTTDGKGTFHGSIAAEKTGQLVRNSNLMVQQQGSGSASVSLVTLGSTQAKINVASTGGTTAMILKGMQANTDFDILVDSTVVATVRSASDGSLAFTRGYDSSDVVEVRVSSGSVPDTTPPTIVTCSPADGATGISIGSSVSLAFSEAVDRSSAESAFSLSDGTEQVAGEFSWSTDGLTLSFAPSSGLTYSTGYTISMGTGLQDLAGNSLQSAYQSHFATEEAPPPPPPPVGDVPSAPLGLKATAGVRQIALSWSAPSSEGSSSVTGYDIYRASASGGPNVLVATIATGASYVDAGLQNGVTCYYVVAAVNSVGEGAQSAEASARTFAVPSAPRTPYAAYQNTAVTVSWSAPSSDGGTAVTGYLVKRSTVPGSEVLIASVGNVLSYTDTGLQNGLTYYYVISAVNAVGAGGSSAEVSAMPGTVPGAPTNLTCAWADSSLTLNWSAPQSAGGRQITGYHVYRGTASGQETFLADLGAVTGYTDDSVVNGVTYYYRITAANAVGESAQSDEVSGTPRTVPGVPLGVSAFGGNEEVRLNWTAPSTDGGADILGYRVYRWTGSDPTRALVASLGVVHEYLDQGLSNGETYFYQVTAVNDAGEGAPSETAQATTDASTPPTPTGLAAVAGDCTVTLSWELQLQQGDTPVVGYIVYRGTSEVDLQKVATVEDGTRTFTDRGLENGFLYWYAVSAFNSEQEGLRSALTSIIPLGEPSAPQSVTVQRLGSSVLLSWAAPAIDNGSAVEGYRIYYSSLQGQETLLANVDASTLLFQHMGLSPGQSCYYRVAAYNGVGEGARSKEAWLTVPALPSAPSGLTLRSGVQSVTLLWQVPASDGGSQLIGYAIYRAAGDGTLIKVTMVPPTSCNYTDTGLTGGVSYTYAVAAVSDIGESPLSGEAQATPISPSPSPSHGDMPSQDQGIVATAGLIGMGTLLAAALVIVAFFMLRKRGRPPAKLLAMLSKMPMGRR